MDWLDSIDKRIIFSVQGKEDNAIYEQVIAAKITGITQVQGVSVVVWIAPLEIRGDEIAVDSKIESFSVNPAGDINMPVQLNDGEEKFWTEAYGKVIKVY